MNAPEGRPDYLAMPLGEFLDAVAAREPAPCGGSVAALAVALAAALTEMSAAFSTGRIDDADELAHTARELRTEVAPLAERDAAAFAEVLTVQALPNDRIDRRSRLDAALLAASETPLRVAQIGSDVAVLAGRLEKQGNPNLRGDARTARLLAAAAVQSAAALVALNLADPHNPLVQQAVALAESARETIA